MVTSGHYEGQLRVPIRSTPSTNSSHNLLSFINPRMHIISSVPRLMVSCPSILSTSRFGGKCLVNCNSSLMIWLLFHNLPTTAGLNFHPALLLSRSDSSILQKLSPFDTLRTAGSLLQKFVDSPPSAIDKKCMFHIPSSSTFNLVFLSFALSFLDVR